MGVYMHSMPTRARKSSGIGIGKSSSKIFVESVSWTSWKSAWQPHLRLRLSCVLTDAAAIGVKNVVEAASVNTRDGAVSARSVAARASANIKRERAIAKTVGRRTCASMGNDEADAKSAEVHVIVHMARGDANAKNAKGLGYANMIADAVSASSVRVPVSVITIGCDLNVGSVGAEACVSIRGGAANARSAVAGAYACMGNAGAGAKIATANVPTLSRLRDAEIALTAQLLTLLPMWLRALLLQPLPPHSQL